MDAFKNLKWKVKSRPGWILLSFLFVLALLILSGPYIERKLPAGAIVNITAGEWLGIFTTWWAMLAVAGYTYVTYSQREAQREQVEVSKSALTESMSQHAQGRQPYLELRLVEHKFLDFPFIDFKTRTVIKIRNVGTGVARNIAITPPELKTTEKIQIPMISVLPPDSSWLELDVSDIGYPKTDDQFENENNGADFFNAVKHTKGNFQVVYQGVSRYEHFKAEFLPNWAHMGFLEIRYQDAING